MSVSLIDNHLSFLPAKVQIAAWEAETPTPPNHPLAKQTLAMAKTTLRRAQQEKQKKDEGQKRITAQAWAVTPAPVRRQILALAGLDIDRWECPIGSFEDGERDLMKVAAQRWALVIDRVMNAL